MMRVSGARERNRHSAAAVAIRDCLPASPVEPHSIRRIPCPPRYFCRIACMQASDHLGFIIKFSHNPRTREKVKKGKSEQSEKAKNGKSYYQYPHRLVCAMHKPK
jgi:hypothetical protein